MHEDEFLSAIERNMKLVDAIHSALVAMQLTNGCAITMEGVRGRLNFEREIGKMMHALCLLDVDGTQVLPVEDEWGRPH